MKKILTRALKANGFDGVHVLYDEGSFGRSVETWIALDNKQVKSATENVGTYDVNDSNIYHSYTDVYEETAEESASPVISSSPKVVQSFISRVENNTSHTLKYYLPVSYSMLDRVMPKPLRTISEELMKTGDVSRPAIERAFL